MNPAQYQLPSTYIPGQEHQMSSYMMKDQNPESLHQGYMNPQIPLNQNLPPIDNKQLSQFQNMGMPQMQPHSTMPGNFPPQEQGGFNTQQKPNILMALNYLQSHPMSQQPNSNFSTGQPQSFPGAGQFPIQGQGQYGFPNPLIGTNPYNSGDQQGRRDYSGGYQQQNRFNKGEHGYRGNNDRRDRDDRGGDRRGDRGERSERSDRGGGYKGDRDRERDRERDRSGRNDRGDRNEHRGGDRGDRRFNNTSDSGRGGKRMDSTRDRKYDRRSRSASRDREKRDGDTRKGNYGGNFRDRDGDKFGNRGGDKGNRYPPKGDSSGARNSHQFNDWKCIDCGNINWARRDSCNRCHVKRPENAPIIPKDTSQGGFKPRGDRSQNHGMNDNVFNRNEFKGGDNFRQNPNIPLQGGEGM